jgi:hypothetical protein
LVGCWTGSSATFAPLRIRFVLASGCILGGWTRSPLSGSTRSAVTFEALAHLRNQIFIAYKLCVPLL